VRGTVCGEGRGAHRRISTAQHKNSNNDDDDDDDDDDNAR
jgi:hypothetical protein